MTTNRVFPQPVKPVLQKTPGRNVDLELAKQRPGSQLARLNSQNVDLRGTHDVRGIVQSSGIERERGAPGGVGNGIGSSNRQP